METINTNIQVLSEEAHWFHQALSSLITSYIQKQEGQEISFTMPEPPQYDPQGSIYGELIALHQLREIERLALMLALAPHWAPQILDPFKIRKAGDQHYSEFGGYSVPQHVGFLPTGETLRFLLVNMGLCGRGSAYHVLDPEAFLVKNHWLALGSAPVGAPRLSGALQLGPEAWGRLTVGRLSAPETDSSFPAQRITTTLEWSDLVLSDRVREEIEHIRMWIEKGNYLLEDLGLKKHLKPGYRSLFYGPPGTGKTLTASLIGKSTGRPVYRIDLSRVVSKYIGETEQNLRRVFDYAEQHEWILFFDEADALFGKRTSTKSSNDRHANQEVAYLLQRIEEFPGVVILASNLRNNLDQAFSRRFQSMVYFPVPDVPQRQQIWEGIFAQGMQPADDLNLEALARDYSLSGGAAINVYRYAALRAVAREETCIRSEDMLAGIARELQKDGKTIPTHHKKR